MYAHLVRPCHVILLCDSRRKEVLDLDLRRGGVGLARLAAADGDRGRVRSLAVLLGHVVHEHHARERAVLVDGLLLVDLEPRLAGAGLRGVGLGGRLGKVDREVLWSGQDGRGR